MKIFLNEKNEKLTKRADAVKGYAISYNVKVLNLLNLELQLEDTESTIKSKLMESLTQLTLRMRSSV